MNGDAEVRNRKIIIVVFLSDRRMVESPAHTKNLLVVEDVLLPNQYFSLNSPIPFSKTSRHVRWLELKAASYLECSVIPIKMCIGSKV